MTRYPSMQICKVCNENLVEDEYHLLLACSACKVIPEKYDDLLDGHDNLVFILKCPPRRVSTDAVQMAVAYLLQHIARSDIQCNMIIDAEPFIHISY